MNRATWIMLKNKDLIHRSIYLRWGSGLDFEALEDIVFENKVPLPWVMLTKAIGSKEIKPPFHFALTLRKNTHSEENWLERKKTVFEFVRGCMKWKEWELEQRRKRTWERGSTMAIPWPRERESENRNCEGSDNGGRCCSSSSCSISYVPASSNNCLLRLSFYFITSYTTIPIYLLALLTFFTHPPT